MAGRGERDAVVTQLKVQLQRETNPDVAEDLQILIRAVDLDDRDEDYGNRREVPYINASEPVFQGLVVLLDDQIAPARREAAIKRTARNPNLQR